MVLGELQGPATTRDQGDSVSRQPRAWAGRQAGRQSGRQAGGQAGRQAGTRCEAGRQVGIRQAGRQPRDWAGRLA